MNDVDAALAVAIALGVGFAVGRYRNEKVWTDRDGAVLLERGDTWTK